MLILPEDSDIGVVRLGYKNEQDSNAELNLTIDAQMTLEEAVDKMLEQVKDTGLKMHKKFTLIFPMDDRHGLAGIMLDMANDREWEFDRHIPNFK